MVGAVVGAQLASAAGGIDLASACPVSSDDPGGPNRLTHHPGNIRAVRVGVVVRSAEPDLQLSNTATLPANLNRPARAAPDGFLRLLLQTSVQVRNLDARAPYYPFYSTAADQLNVGGG